jgi:hypothetical protein
MQPGNKELCLEVVSYGSVSGNPAVRLQIIDGIHILRHVISFGRNESFEGLDVLGEVV